MQDVLFYSSNNYIEAKQVQDILNQNNIVNYIKNEHIQNLFGDTRFLFGKDIIAGDIKIMVSENDFDYACKVIEESGLLSNSKLHDEESTLGLEISSDTKEKTSGSLLGNSAAPNTNVFQMVTFSYLSFLVLPVFFNIKNFTHFWNTRRPLVISCIVLTALMSTIPIALFFYNMQTMFPFVYMVALIGSFWLVIKGYKRFKAKHDIVSFLMAVPFILIIIASFLIKS